MHQIDDSRRPAGTRGPGRRTALERLDGAAVSVAARTGVSPRAVLGLALVALVIVVVLWVRLAWARSAAAPVPIPPAAPAMGVQGRPGPGATATASTAPTATTTRSPAGQVVVHVVGHVVRPGVVRLPVGARVQDAVQAAGGPRRGADLSAVNLARPLVDGEQVLVPRPGESPVAAPVPPMSGSAGPPGSPGPGPNALVVNLNTATLAELDSLPGVGPVLAQRILDWRAQNGRFTAVDELGEVSGIGDAVLERLRPRVRV